MKQNWEFLVYVVVSFVVALIVYFADKKFNFPVFAKVGFLVWLFLHFAGGLFRYGETAWYGIIFFNIVGDPYYILRYDQVLHFFFYFIASIFLYGVVVHYTKPKTSKKALFFLTVLVAVGVGALNEIVEFAVYVYAENTGVGTYINNALDLVFNTVGAIVGTLLAMKLKKGF